jgi:hypothetical protein
VLTAMFARHSPERRRPRELDAGERGWSVDAVGRSAHAPPALRFSRSLSRLEDAAASPGRTGRYSAHRNHRLGRPEGTRRRAAVVRARLQGGDLVICDKGYASRDLEDTTSERFSATILRPVRKDEPGRLRAPYWIRQRIESIFWTL